MKMKNFNEMTQSEINAMSKEDFMAVSPFEKRSCYNCFFLTGSISWWCINKDAQKERGTSIPGCIKCIYWKPDWNNIDEKYKTEENGYIKPIESTKQTVLGFYAKWYQIILKYFM